VPPPLHSGAALHSRHRVCVVVGTRPEAIKLAPVIRELQAREGTVECLVVATSQHREMLRQALSAFGLRADVDLDLMVHAQDHREFTVRAMLALRDSFAQLRPSAVVVQGDTSTVAAAAIIARASGVLIGHVEAGLRSGSLSDPFPEEMNRRIATMVADLHFAPTEYARGQLLAEGIAPDSVIVTGNTAIDALASFPCEGSVGDPLLDTLPWTEHKVLLATVHRRENHGTRLRQICAALRILAERHERVQIIVPVHRNPNVRGIVEETLAGRDRIHLVDPLPYPVLLGVLRRCHLVLSDSGGLQEEVPSFGKPILILRDRTERPEVLNAGFGRLVGAATDEIVTEATRLIDDPRAYAAMRGGANPFGDGRAAGRIVDALLARLEPAPNGGAPADLVTAP
jgi:UDP-N-acetylglucosamine 2-epimerase (non-hydrolysing)